MHRLSLLLTFLCLSSTWLAAQDARQARLLVCSTTPDLGSLAATVGGEDVMVQVICKGAEDPHFVEARPSLVKMLSSADVLLLNGLELEIGWLPVLLQNCRNGKVQPGTSGYVDASSVVKPLGVPTGPVDRSQGDVHLSGNPHYLLDPLQGWHVAQLLRDRLSRLRPAQEQAFTRRCAAFGDRLGAALVGEDLARKYEFEKLVLLHEHRQLDAFLRKQGDTPVAGWIGMLAPHAGAKVLVDHDLWPYFLRRFQLDTLATLEPKPGIPPTTRHLQGLVDAARAAGCRAILAAPYYDARHAEFVARHTGAAVVAVAHQTGSRTGIEDYAAMVDHNVRELARALRAPR